MGNNPAPLLAPMEFTISFECAEDLNDGTYVSSFGVWLLWPFCAAQRHAFCIVPSRLFFILCHVVRLCLLTVFIFLLSLSPSLSVFSSSLIARLAGDHRQRKVPRRDARHHADRVVRHVVDRLIERDALASREPSQFAHASSLCAPSPSCTTQHPRHRP